MMFRGKRGVGMVMGTIVFIILNVLFLILILFAISRAGNVGIVYEEAYAKQIALMINRAKPGTIIEVDLAELYSIANEGGVEPEVFINCNKKEVFVKATNKGGYSYAYNGNFRGCNDFEIKNRKLVVII
jgi:hypothetical protein